MKQSASATNILIPKKINDLKPEFKIDLTLKEGEI
jgi:hypothetical protein